MIQRLYIHNFRCLENFELSASGQSSVLLIGKNGCGKTTIGLALEIFQQIARGTNRVGQLVRPKDLTRGRTDTPVRFEIEVQLAAKTYKYTLAFELPQGFRELRVLEENLTVDGAPIYTREIAQVQLANAGQEHAASFRIDWHLVALPIIQRQSSNDPLYIFKKWLASILILRPVPSLIRGDSNQATLQPDIQVSNFGAWYSGVASAASAYRKMEGYLKQVMPDLLDLKNPMSGKEVRSLEIQFSRPNGEGVTDPLETTTVAFDDLSDGEKCFMICALVIAANGAAEPLLCFWDEPDNYLAPSEVGPSVMALRKAFLRVGQLIVTSHNPEAIRQFSDENTLLLDRKSHLEPTIVRSLQKIRASGVLKGDLIEALVRGDVAV